jgi:hypothetical protein
VHVVGHHVVTLSHVTCPCSPVAQLRSAAEQLVVLLLPVQVTVPEAQFAVALHRDFSKPALGLLAAKSTVLCGSGQEPVTAEGPRIAASASRVRGAGLGFWAKPATDTKRRVQATMHAFFIQSLLLCS